MLSISSYYHETNQPEKCLVFLEKILEKSPDNLLALTNKGIILHILKKNDQALECYEKVLEINGDFTPALLNKAILHFESNESEESKNLLEKIIDLEPQNMLALLTKGVLIFEKFNKPFEAIQCYDSILSIDPFNFGALHNKSVVLKSLNKLDEALLCYEKILEKNPNDETALAFKGYMIAVKGEHEKALNYFNKSLSSQPNNMITLVNKAVSLRHLKRYDEADAVLDSAMVIDAKYPSCIFEKACVRSFQGKINDALDFLKQAIDLNPKFRKLALKHLDKKTVNDPRFQKIIGVKT